MTDNYQKNTPSDRFNHKLSISIDLSKLEYENDKKQVNYN